MSLENTGETTNLLQVSWLRPGLPSPSRGVTPRDYYRPSVLRNFDHLKLGQPLLSWGGRRRAVPTFTLRASSERR